MQKIEIKIRVSLEGRNDEDSIERVVGEHVRKMCQEMMGLYCAVAVSHQTDFGKTEKEQAENPRAGSVHPMPVGLVTCNGRNGFFKPE